MIIISVQHVLTYIASLSNSNSPETLPQHRPIPPGSSGQVAADPTTAFRVILIHVKLDSKKFYDKI